MRDRQVGNFKFRRQHVIGSYIADFCCVEKKVVIEVNGRDWADYKFSLVFRPLTPTLYHGHCFAVPKGRGRHLVKKIFLNFQGQIDDPIGRLIAKNK